MTMMATIIGTILLNRLQSSSNTAGRSSDPPTDVDSHTVRLCVLWALSSWAEGEEAAPHRCPPVQHPTDTGHVTHVHF